MKTTCLKHYPILFFGGLWGFWGVFFAIPLATLVQAVLTAWPRLGAEEEIEQEAVPAASNLTPDPNITSNPSHDG